MAPQRKTKKKVTPSRKKGTLSPSDFMNHLSLLRTFISIKDPALRRKIIRVADPKLVSCFEALSRNILSGNIKSATLTKHIGCLEKLASPRIGINKKKTFLASKQTGKFFGALLSAIPAIAGTIGSLFTKR